MRRLLPLFLLLVGIASASKATAAVPSPSNSSLDPCLTLCPYGDMVFNVVVRDIANNPVAGSTVQLDFCSCTAVHFCPVKPTDPYAINGCLVSAVTNAAGQVSFPIRAGGICVGPVNIRADGVLLGTRALASPDMDGSLFVNGTDSAILTGLIGAAGQQYDLACDQTVVTAADLAVLQAHLGHTCDNIVPVQPHSWGGLKILYR